MSLANTRLGPSHSRVDQVLRLLNIDVPIIQAPIGGCATVELAGEVARAGGLGSMALTWTMASEAVAKVRKLKARAGNRFFVNYVLRFEPHSLDAVLAEGAPAVTLSWGLSEKLIATIKASGARVGVQVGHPEGARLAAGAGADFLICQGCEAGGHVQSTMPLAQLLPEVLRVSAHLPVVATGGITTAVHIATWISAGASAVMMGTRFIASQEANAHVDYKNAIIAAKQGDTALTNCFDIDWPYAMMGTLRNSTLNTWEAAGCPAAPNRPGEGDVVAVQGAGPILRYSDNQPFADAAGDPLAACLYAGAGSSEIHEIIPAHDIVTGFWRDVKRILSSTPSADELQETLQ